MSSDNSDLIHQFTAHQSRTKQQSHDDDNVEGETNGTGGSNGTLRVPHYQEKVCATCYKKFIDAGGATRYCHRREDSVVPLCFSHDLYMSNLRDFHLHFIPFIAFYTIVKESTTFLVSIL